MATTTTKKVTSTNVLAKDIFEVEVNNHELLKLVYESYLANSRPNLAKTLRRGEVRGGGKKPWKQKGTGRARFGSSRNPIWRKGGIVFGPLGIENYSKKISTGAKRVALRQALTLANQAGKLVIVDDIKTTGKTKEVNAFLASNKVEAPRILMVVDKKSDELIRATANLQPVLLCSAKYLSVFNILNADKIVITKPALTVVAEWLGGAK